MPTSTKPLSYSSTFWFNWRNCQLVFNKTAILSLTLNVYTVANIWCHQIFAVLKYVVVTYFCFHDSVGFVGGSSPLGCLAAHSGLG